MHDYEFKIIMIGSSGAGKSAILERFCNNIFIQSNERSTGMDMRIKYVHVKDKKVKFDIWDMSDQPKFSNLTETFFKGAQGIFIVFDGTLKEPDVDRWINIVNNQVTKIPVIVIGNKSDIKPVKYEGDLEYFNVSAKDGTNIDNAFHRIGEHMIDFLYSKPMYTVQLRENSPIRNYVPKKDHSCCIIL